MHQISYSQKSKTTLFAAGIVLAGLLLLLLANPVSADTTSASTVFIEKYTLTPTVLAPGDSGTITVVIKNTANTATQRESTGISPGGIFASEQTTDVKTVIDSIGLDGNGMEVLSDNYHRFGAIGPGQSVPVTFSIRAPMKDGMYYPEVWVDIDGGKNVRYPIPVNVNSRDQVLQAPAIVTGKSLPDSINPGDSFIVILDLKNAGALRANQLTLSMSTSTPSIGVKGPNSLALSDIEAGASRPVELDFITDRNAPIGLQQINLQLSYQLPDGTTKQQTEQIQVPMKGEARMSIASVTIDPPMPTAGNTVNLIIRLENTGTDTAKSVIAAIDLPLEGTKEAFIGKILVDNDAPAIFTVVAEKPGDYAYNLTVNYSDEGGDHTLTRPMHQLVAPVDRTPLIVLVVVIIAIAAFYFLYWRRRGSQ